VGECLRPSGQLPEVSHESREVDVRLPPGYDEAKTISYPIVYMQDGQNLFDPDPGAEHSETSWAARVDIPMRFLLAGGSSN